MEYISVRELSKYSGICKRTLKHWCKLQKFITHKVHGNGGVRYEILVSSLPEDLRKKVAEKSTLEHGVYVNCSTSSCPTAQPPFALEHGIKTDCSTSSCPGSFQQGEGVTKPPFTLGFNTECNGYSLKNIQSAQTQKTLEPPITAQVSVQVSAQNSLLSSNQTDGIYHDIPGNIPDINDCMKKSDNSIGVSLENNTDFSYNNPAESCDKVLIPFKKGEVSKEYETLSKEQVQTLVSFGAMNNEKEVKSATESQKKKALAWVDLIELWEEYRCNKSHKSEELLTVRSEELEIRNEKRRTNKSAFIPDINAELNGYLLNGYLQKKDKSADMAQIDSEFVELYNSRVIYPELYKQIGKISRSTLHRKAKIYKENKKDFYSLIPDYGNNNNNKFNSKLSLIERYYLLKIMLHQNCYTLGRAYEIIRRILAKEDIKICSYSAYKRIWDYVMKNDYARVMFARGGLKVYKDKAAPYIMRKNNVLGFGDELIGDGHTLDFMVRNPFNGKPTRAALIGFLDSASGDLAGYDIMLTENTQVIASALRNAIIYMGKYPKIVHLDNGRAFKSKYFTQTASLKTTNIQGLYSKLGIETLFSKAYNGRAKTIERFFKEFTESEAKTWSSYIGNCIDNKPAHTKRNEKFHGSLAGGYIPAIQEVKAGIDLWLNEVYRKRTCKANNNLTIEEYVNQNKGAWVNIDELDDLMMAAEMRKIQRNGVKLFDTYYWSEKLFGLKDNCIIKYSYFDLSYVKVYSLKGEYICKAERMIECHPLARQLGTARDYEEYKYMTRRLEKLDKETLKPLKKMLKNMYKPEKQVSCITSEGCIQELDTKRLLPAAVNQNTYIEAQTMADKCDYTANVISKEPDNDYEDLDGEFFEELLKERQAEIWGDERW